MISVTAQVEGASWTLRKLFRIAPELRAQTVKEIKSAAAPIVATAKASVPATTGLKGWTDHDGRWSYGAAHVRKSIGVDYRQRKRDRNNQWTMVRVRLNDGIGQVYDMGGRRGSAGYSKSGSAMLAKLIKERGAASRIMWPAAEANAAAVQAAVKRAVENATERLNAELRVV